MEEVFSRVAGLDHMAYDCFACAVLSHGDKEVVFGVDGQRVGLDKLKATMAVPSLLGKPKIFFIQACQGSKYNELCCCDSSVTQVR
jgi:hypothetical protein